MNTNIENTNDKTYTHEELDKIVQDSIAAEREKLQKEHSAAMAEMEQSIKVRELRMNAIEQLQSKGLPTSLVDALNCSDEDTMNNSIKILSKAYETQNIKATQEGAPAGISPAKESGFRSFDPIRNAMGL